MLPSNIDLTEHMDFSRDLNGLMDIPVEIPMDEFALMTADQYERLYRLECIFGKHVYSEKLRIFGMNKEIPSYREDECERCGKSLKVPWKRFYGLCEDCNRIMDRDCDVRVPWKQKHNTPRRDSAREIFSMR